MKILSALALTLEVSSVWASLASISDEAQKAIDDNEEAKKLAHAHADANAPSRGPGGPPGGGGRNLGVTLGVNAMQAIEDYGCWCYFDDKHGSGRGAPVDSVDAMCKNLAMAYDCAMMDYAEATGNDDCIPWEVSFNAGLSFGIGALVDTCNQINDDLCAQFACMAEGAFVINIIGAFLNVGTVNPSNQQGNGFDFAANCAVNSGTQTDERLCCGVLPYRYPYKPVDRECCGASTYDPSLMDCCVDNTPQFSCV